MSVFSTSNVGAKVDIKERGILMSAPMVRVSLDESKTQTRREVKWRGLEPGLNLQFSGLSVERSGSNWVLSSPTRTSHEYRSVPMPCPYGKPGDRLWVRESYSGPHILTGIPPRDWPPIAEIWYWADGKIPTHGDWTKPKPGMHMPRWASRITLEIVKIRVERLQDISEADAMAEGITCENVVVGSNCNGGVHHEETADRFFFDGCPDEGFETGIDAYAALWDHINGAGEWDKNPWVWVVEFKRLP